ncbi:hypothetical protein D3C83_161380 [compost metagenome]
MRPLGEFPRTHPLKEIEVLVDRTIAKWAVLPRLGQRAPRFTDLLFVRAVDVGFALADETDREVVHRLEIV